MKKIFLSAALSACCFASAVAQDWGNVSGQIVATGAIPAPELLHKAGADIKDKAVCAAGDTFKDDLLIDKDSKGVANVFVPHYRPVDQQRRPTPAVLWHQDRWSMKSRP